MQIRAYAAADSAALWALKVRFERELGSETGGAEKAAAYEAKLTDDYRHRYLGWVARCTASDPACITVADPADGAGDLAGYAFVLPEHLSFVWDAAVLNELYLRPEYRGTGVADDLVESALDVARDQDLPLDRMVLDVDGANDRARAFYRRHGFENWGEMVARDL